MDSLYSFMQGRCRYLPYYYALITGIQFAAFKEALNGYDQGNILDLGCGNGSFAQGLFAKKETSRKLFGLDVGFNFVKEAKDRKIYYALTAADCRRIAFRDNFFDLVFSNSVIEHIPGVDSILKEVIRILKNDLPGLFVFTVPLPRFAKFAFSWLNIFPKGMQKIVLNSRFLRIVNLLGKEEWRNKLEENGFEIIELRTYMSDPALISANLLNLEPVIWYFSEKLLGRPLRIPFSKNIVKGLYNLNRYFIKGKGELLAIARKKAG